MNTAFFRDNGVRLKLIKALHDLDREKFNCHGVGKQGFVCEGILISDSVMLAHLVEELGFGHFSALAVALERVFGESPVELVAETPHPEGPESGLDIQFVLFGNCNFTLSGPTNPSLDQRVVVSGVFPWVVPYIGFATNDKWPWGDWDSFPG
jgi:hypothetical protein